ncbi:MAG: hypothetical protein QME77_12780 [bacterium]|nr:hypothetical protein [bacterium]
MSNRPAQPPDTPRSHGAAPEWDPRAAVAAARGEPQRDAFDLVGEIRALEMSLATLEREVIVGLEAHACARRALFDAEATLRVLKERFAISKTRLSALQSLLRALPR